MDRLNNGERFQIFHFIVFRRLGPVGLLFRQSLSLRKPTSFDLVREAGKGGGRSIACTVYSEGVMIDDCQVYTN